MAVQRKPDTKPMRRSGLPRLLGSPGAARLPADRIQYALCLLRFHRGRAIGLNAADYDLELSRGFEEKAHSIRCLP